jgi:hypothetical protein
MPYNRAYSDEQRDAIHEAYCDRHIRPLRKIVEAAAGGTLKAAGAPVEAFTVDVRTVGRMGNEEERRRAGLAQTKLAKLPAADALEDMRRRLTNVADWSLKRLEWKMTKIGAPLPDVGYARQVAQLAREIKALASPPAMREVNVPDPRQPEKASPLARQALRAINATSADTDTASVEGTNAFDSYGSPEKGDSVSTHAADRGDFPTVPGTPPGGSLEQELRHQLYGE